VCGCAEHEACMMSTVAAARDTKHNRRKHKGTRTRIMSEY
jgi:hypothetical protein